MAAQGTKNSDTDRFDPERLREICWDIGQRFPPPGGADHMAFGIVHARLGYLRWHVNEGSVEVRVYDVTAIDFDGFNAHSFFDIDVNTLSGNWYLPVADMDRDLMGELGYRMPDGGFHGLARSNIRRFDRDRPSGRALRGARLPAPVPGGERHGRPGLRAPEFRALRIPS